MSVRRRLPVWLVTTFTTYETVEATIQGEGVALTDTEISMPKLTAFAAAYRYRYPGYSD